MTDQASIVEFANPPVIEVVLAVAFEPIAGLTVPKLVLAWDRKFKDTFPESEGQPAYHPPIERFGAQRYGPGFQLEIGGGVPSPRFWFLDKEGSNLLQLQENWFARNWRKQDESGTYTRYGRLREAFRTDLGLFAEFLREEGLGEVMATQCELTYIDHITPNDCWKTHADASKVFDVVDFGRHDFLSGEPEDVQFALTYIIPGDEGAGIGRLRISAQSAIRKSDRAPIFVVNTTARGAPIGPAVDGVLGFLDVAHTWAVRGFIDVTTGEMHEAWGRKNA